jgi:superfamily II helicase
MEDNLITKPAFIYKPPIYYICDKCKERRFIKEPYTIGYRNEKICKLCVDKEYRENLLTELKFKGYTKSDEILVVEGITEE